MLQQRLLLGLSEPQPFAAVYDPPVLPLLLGCAPDAPAAAAIPTADPPPVAVAAAEPPPPPPRWPSAGAPLHPPTPPSPPSRPVHVVIDAGHGAPGNLGNTNVKCEREADVTKRIQDAVIARLAGERGLEVRAGRPSGLLSCDDRIAAFEAWPADYVVSLHSDTRAGDGWVVDPTTGCWSGTGAAGFAVLYSDEGAPGRASARLALARAVATRMGEAGFLPYPGEDYPGLYGADSTAGVFVDRHAMKKRIKMLRRPRVPLVIVETHQAVDPDEAARWEEPATLDAFAAAIEAAVLDLAR